MTDEGVLFAETGGRRSSSSAARALLAAAARPVDPGLAAEIESCRDWRHGYLPLVVRQEAAAAGDSAAIVAAARAGLAELDRQLVFAADGTEQPLAAALRTPSGRQLQTETVLGTGRRPDRVEIPYRGRLLTGAELDRQLADWVSRGVVEPSCAAAVQAVAARPAYLDATDLTAVVLGAGAEMGPVPALLRWGATVVAVDVPRPAIWSRLTALAATGAGRLVLPTVAGQPGADLLTELPALRRWLLQVVDGPAVVGSYAYAAGSAFLRLAAAGDALVADFLRERPGSATALLATPTDAFAVPPELVQGALDSPRAGRGRLLRTVSAGRLYRPRYAAGAGWAVADSLVAQQGPSYALAKRLQRWRAVTAAAAGVVSSANVAPATRTRSVVQNRLLAMAYAGADRFGVEVFEPETSAALMAVLLLHDLRSGQRPDPARLFVDQAAHGGLWRLPHQPRSVLPLAAAVGAFSRR